MEHWLFRYGAALQERTGGGDHGFVLGESESEALLQLAKLVADGTGDRRNAPLTCYLAGRLAGLRVAEGVTTERVIAEATEVASALLDKD